MTESSAIWIALDPDAKAIIALREGMILTKNDIVCLARELNRSQDLAKAEWTRGYGEGYEEGAQRWHWHKEGSPKMVNGEVEK